MVFTTNDLLTPMATMGDDDSAHLHDLMGDDALLDAVINYMPADDMAWMASTDESDSDLLVALSRSLSPTSESTWNEVIFNTHLAISSIDSSSESGLYSPSDSPTFESQSYSDFEDDNANGELDLSSPSKRKAADDDYEGEEPSSKKIRSIKKACAKKTRRAAEGAVAKSISALHAEFTEGPTCRRRIHNVLERKRRNDLKSSYQELRELIPELITCDRAPTGQILMKAVEYIQALQDEERQIEAKLAATRAENERLRLM